MDSVTTETGAGRGPAAVADPGALREVMARFATGVTVLSTGGEHIHGMTANAFTSVSLDPPAVLCCVGRSAVMHEAISAAGHFGVSIMEAAQEDVVRFFADKRRPLGPEQFRQIDWTPGPHTGAPLLAGALAWLECDLSAAYGFGDHSIFIGQVVAARRGSGHDGLLFFDGAFQRAVARGV